MSIALGLGLLACGCGKPVLRVADASLGDYYSAKEYRKLRKEQREEYCQELADQDSSYREEIADARSALDRFTLRAGRARAAADSLAALADSLEAKVAAVAALEASMKSHLPPGSNVRGSITRRGEVFATGGPAAGSVGAAVTVRAGDSLWRIAARDSTYGDGRRWNELYQANRDRIRSADRIYPGQELVLPR
jgi:nucleoid-associated protein YgaU